MIEANRVVSWIHLTRGFLGVMLGILLILMTGCGDTVADLEDNKTIAETMFVDPLNPTNMARQAEDMRLIDEHIVQCMKAQGFDYIAPRRETFDEHYFNWLVSIDYASEFGLGISTTHFEQLADPGDPNEAYRSSMSRAEADSYWQTLRGSDTDTSDSCISQAQASRPVLQFIESNQEELSELEDLVNADDRILRHHAESIRCVRVQGLEIDSRDGVLEDIASSLGLIVDRVTYSDDSPEPILSSTDFEQLEELKHTERRYAVAFHECNLIGQSYRELVAKVRREYADDLIRLLDGAFEE